MQRTILIYHVANVDQLVEFDEDDFHLDWSDIARHHHVGGQLLNPCW